LLPACYAPTNESFFVSSLAMEHRHAFGKLFKGWPTCGYFGQNLGSLNINVMISYMLFKPQQRIPAE
jgi:hypothetical protein